MINSAQFDRNMLPAVKPGIDSTLADIGAQIEKYLAAPADNAPGLEAARTGLHSLQGVLKMVGLVGAAAFCAELELALGELATNPDQISAMHRDVLHRAMFAITHYLDSVANGADNVSLRLFPQYQELQQLRGLEMSFELDLFYPDLSVQLPSQVLSLPVQNDGVAPVKMWRSQYQQGLLKWMRQEDTAGSAQQMQQALEGVLRSLPQEQSRAFWWVGYGLLDCVKLDGLPPEMNVRKLLSRIDQQLRAVVDGKSGDIVPVMNEMLYLIGNSHAVSEHVEAIKQVYSLDQYLPEQSALSPGEVEQMLGTMHDQLSVAEEYWEQCAQGDAAACEKFSKQVEQIALQSDKLDRDVLQYLAKQIQMLSQYATSPEHARPIAIDMAMALLLLGSGIENYRRIGGSFQEQARILVERMQAAVKQKPEDTKRLAELVELHYRMEQPGEVMVSLASEMSVNLQQVEQGLNAFFNNVIGREELPEMLRLLNQVQGGLRISFLQDAERLLASIQEKIGRFAQSGEAPKPAEKIALADAISALEDYLLRLTHGQPAEVAGLQAALAEMLGHNLSQDAEPVLPEAAPAGEGAEPLEFIVPVDQAAEPVALEIAPAEPPQASPEISHRSEEDRELLAIFLEEAQEVLATMLRNLDTCQLHPDSHEPLVAIRRGFHTLKGSGRMVGLTDLGEVAWCVERAMNKWLQYNKTATPSLLSFIRTTIKSFVGWVDTLSKQGAVSIEAEDLIASAQQIEDGLDADIQQPAAPTGELTVAAPGSAQNIEMPAATAVSESSAAEGDATMHSPVLFSIASAEVKQNVTVLHHQLDELRTAAPPMVQYDFMRAAHTLAGVSRTMGFAAVVELAYALEGWLHARLEKIFTLSGSQLQMLDEAVNALDEMVQNVCQKQIPQLRGDLVGQLVSDRDNFTEVVSESTGVESANDLADLVLPFEFLPEQQTDTDQTPIPEQNAVPDQSPATEQQATPEQSPATEQQPSPDQSAMPGDIGKPVRLADYDPLLAAIAEPPKPAENLLQDVFETEPAVDGPVKPAVFDDVDAQLLPVFLEEAEDLCPQISERLRVWREPPHDQHQVPILKRLLHTIKGSSRMVGAMRIGEIAHEMEGRVLAADELSTEAGYWDGLENDFDHIMSLLKELRDGKPAEEPRPVPTGRRESDQIAGVERRADRRAPEAGAGTTGLVNMLRVRAEVVDRLVNEAGEISVARSRMETEMRVLKEGLLELTASVVRLRQQLREVEIQAESQMQARVMLAKENAELFDPLEFDRFTRLQELTRFMNESVHDVHTIQQSMLQNLDQTTAVMMVQNRLNKDLQQGLMNVRMVSFNSITDRLYRIVRQTGKELNKRANLELQDTSVELDRSVLEKMVAPFEHLLRNSIVHGLESEEQRVKSGKLPIGEIRLSVHQEGNEVVFEFSDDGAGLNFAKLREQAIASGSMRNDELVNDDQLAQLIFTPGLSTAAEITEIAGRGIGMDVVRSEISSLGGRIEVSSKRGEGTQFLIYLPLTLAVTQVLMVSAGDQVYAIPSTLVEQVRQAKPAEMEILHKEQHIEWQGNSYPLHYLPHLLGNMEVVQENQLRNMVLLLRSGTQRIALTVDALLGNQEAMVKNIGPQLARLQGIAGATVQGDGRVVLILNPVQFAQRIRSGSVQAMAGEKPLNTSPLIMVVDDSLTVRKITSRILGRAGYQVMTATDGVDALEKMQESMPDVMILDIEMPRMDGFALVRELRRVPETENLPIIMITSRTANKHREYAMQLGVNTYLGKPYQEDELLQKIADFVAVHKLDL
jgi:chemosensory pili system protein ChpA (sensor histidine kinase/response regulator)